MSNIPILLTQFCNQSPKNCSLDGQLKTDFNKQIMTDLEGNRQIYLPERFRIASPRVSIDRGPAEVNRNPWRGDTESQGANR